MKLFDKLLCKHEWKKGKLNTYHNVFANICGCQHGDGNRIQKFREYVCKNCGRTKRIRVNTSEFWDGHSNTRKEEK